MSKPVDISMYRMSAGSRWETHTFLPIFDDVFVWCTDVLHSFCSHSCSLACYCHPLVQDPKNENNYYKLCTLSVALVGLIDLKQLTAFKGGCSGKDSDYQKAVRLLKNLKFVPTKQEKVVS